MIVTDSEPYINGIQMGDVTIHCFIDPPSLSAKYSLISVQDMTTGRMVTSLPAPEGAVLQSIRHGLLTAAAGDEFNRAQWSAETMQKLAELITSMERDLISRHFKEDTNVHRHEGLESGAALEEDGEAPQV